MRDLVSIEDASVVIRDAIGRLNELVHKDMSGLHVSKEWSDIPYPDDHLAFVRDQLVGLLAALREGPVEKGPAVVVLEGDRSVDLVG